MKKPTQDTEQMPEGVTGPLEIPEGRHRELFTLEKIRKDPERIKRVQRALAEGFPIMGIARAEGISHQVVGIISDLDPSLRSEAKKRLAGKFRFGSILALEQALEAVANGEMPAASLSVAAGIFADKSQQLAGEASTIVEHRTLVDPVALAKRAKSALSGTVIDAEEVTPKQITAPDGDHE
jgi:hypothetical protein